jgi:hypothetical protein
VKDVTLNQRGWKGDKELVEMLAAELNAKIGQISSQKNSIIKDESLDPELKDFYYMKRDVSKLKKPIALAFPENQEKAAQFQCVLPVDEVLATVFGSPLSVNTKEWALAAACFYSYANSIESYLICAGAGGALAAAGLAAPEAALAATGLGALPAAITTAGGVIGAAGIAAYSCDVMLRSPILWWCAGNRKWEFFFANLAYIIICGVFESIGAYQGTRLVPNKWKIRLLSFITQTSTAFWTFFSCPGSDEESMQKVVDFFEHPEKIAPLISASEDEMWKSIRDRYTKY